jgi:hypothetical protein
MGDITYKDNAYYINKCSITFMFVSTFVSQVIYKLNHLQAKLLKSVISKAVISKVVISKVVISKVVISKVVISYVVISKVVVRNAGLK